MSVCIIPSLDRGLESHVSDYPHFCLRIFTALHQDPFFNHTLISSACCYNYLLSTLFVALNWVHMLPAECRSLYACPPSLGSGPGGDVIFHSVILSPYDLLDYEFLRLFLSFMIWADFRSATKELRFIWFFLHGKTGCMEQGKEDHEAKWHFYQICQKQLTNSWCLP